MTQRSKFQQRHYEDIAQLFQDNVPRPHLKVQTRAEYREQLIRAFVDLFGHDNPYFNPDRFRLACVPGNNVAGNRRVGPAMPYMRPRG